MKTFKQILSEAKKKNKETQQNIEGGDMSKPYKTPDDIRDIMSRSAGDDSISSDWGINHTAQEQGIRRGAESVESEEELTPARQAELAQSQEILGNLEGSGINPNPNFTTARGGDGGHLYSNSDIADILNAKGITTLRGKQWTHQLVDLVAKQAKEKLANRLMDII